MAVRRRCGACTPPLIYVACAWEGGMPGQTFRGVIAGKAVGAHMWSSQVQFNPTITGYPKEDGPEEPDHYLVTLEVSAAYSCDL